MFPILCVCKAVNHTTLVEHVQSICINFYVAMTTPSLRVLCAGFESIQKSNVISGGSKKQN